MNLLKLLVFVSCLFSYSISFAAYNANMSGKVSAIMVYAEGDYIYIKLENQPTSHPTCNPSYFVVPGSIPYERRQMIMSRLMTAKVTKEIINLGFDDKASCSNGYIQLYRAG